MTTPQEKKARYFPLGALVITRNAFSVLSQTDVITGLRRHMRCDWGDLDLEDTTANDRALEEGSRLLSAYRSLSGAKFWIITECDRSATTILLPEEY